MEVIKQTDSEHSSKAPATSSQAPDDSVPKPKASGASVGKVLYDSGDSFKRFMSSHVKELIKELRAAKVITKPFTKWIKSEKEYQIDKLLSEMKKISPDKFANYLELLLSLAEKDKDEKEKPSQESVGAVQRTIQDDAKKLIGTMKGTLDDMKPEPDSKLDEMISNIKVFLDKDSSGTVTDQTTLKTDPIQVDQSLISAPIKPPPPGQLGDSVGGVFTNEGGILYSPLHGVTVTIPPNAISGAVHKFYLSMHFYLLGPFTLEDEVELCSVIVWFHQSPQVHFVKDVEIKIPHAAVVPDTKDDSLFVLTWDQDKQLKLNTKVPADFSDGYHAVFKVKHFCPKAIGMKKRRTVRRKLKKFLEKMGSSSFESSIEEGMASRSNSLEAGQQTRGALHHQEAMDCDSPAPAVSQDSIGEEELSDMKYSIVCGMPRDRSQRNWNVLFAACYSNPTWNWELVKLIKRTFGEDADLQPMSCLRIRGGYFKLCKESSWSDDNWEIESHVRPSEISVQSIHEIPEKPFPEEMVPLYPPRITFEASSSREFDHPKLKCWIEARGAQTTSGSKISFLVKSTPPPLADNGERVLRTARYLYADNSDIIEALTSTEGNLVLNISEIDHRKFLADISLQISDKQRLCEVLDRLRDADLDAYMILSNWVALLSNDVTIAQLKKQLRSIKIVDIKVCENETKHQLLSPHLENEYMVMHWDNHCEPIVILSQKLQCCWRNVGRLVGISENDLSSIKHDLDDCESYQMLLKWQSRGATFGTLFKAIHRMCYHAPTLVLDAHHFSIHYVDKYFSKGNT